VLNGALAVFMDAYAEHLFVHSEVYPGVPDALAALKAAGMVVGCVTNKPEAFAETLLEQAEMRTLFDFVFGGDTFPAMKPDPEPLNQAAARFGVSPAACVMVGDSANDREAARRAGFRFVLASYGYLPSAEASLEPEDMRIAGFAELPQLLCGQ
jgi:phosphoglycolate phosphatase